MPGKTSGSPSIPSELENIEENIKSFSERIMGDDDEKKRIGKEIAIGAVSGWVTGYASMKIGKVAATAIGGGLILLQIANSKGYIKINWSRVNNDVEKVKSRIQEETTGRKADWADKLEKKTTDVLKGKKRWFQNLIREDNDTIVRDVAIYTGSFVLGFGIGVVTGN